MQLKAGYGSVCGLPCDEGKSLTWLTCKRAHAGRLDWGLKTSITFVWLSIYQYTDFHFSSPAEFPVHEPQLYVAHLYLWCARRWNTSCSYFSLWYIASFLAVHAAGPPDRCSIMPNHLLCEHLIWSWSPLPSPSIHQSNYYLNSVQQRATINPFQLNFILYHFFNWFINTKPYCWNKSYLNAQVTLWGWR